MIKNLNIKNYALIEDIDIDLANGMTTVTGETGAGKSIILGAISLLAGSRADRSMIKNADKKCIIEATFDIGRLNLKGLFDKLDLDHEDETIIRREFTKDGKSRVFINDSPAILSSLKEVMNRVLDVHSQHENLALNNRRYQLNALDLMAGNQDILKEYKVVFHEFIEAGNRLNELKSASERLKENTEILHLQLNELTEANLIEGELEELEEELDVLNHSEEIKGDFRSIDALMNDIESDPISKLNQVGSLLRQISNHYSEISDLSDRMKNALIELDDIQREIDRHAEQFTYDPERLQIIQDRVSSIFQLQQKYRVNTEIELIELREKISEEVQDIDNFDERLEQAEKNYTLKKKRAEDIAKSISDSRKEIAIGFQEGILKHLQNLGMPNSRFIIDLERKDLSIDGMDTAEFLFSANKGIEVEPIGKVASGGELSRVMLSIKAVLTSKTELPTIIFDEIDTGISGLIAEKMGRIIREMCHSTQVLSITHLPQIAAMGDHHLVVYKDDSGEVSKTKIREIEGEERTSEVARLLSGEEISKEALDNAKVLLSATT